MDKTKESDCGTLSDSARIRCFFRPDHHRWRRLRSMEACSSPSSHLSGLGSGRFARAATDRAIRRPVTFEHDVCLHSVAGYRRPNLPGIVCSPDHPLFGHVCYYAGWRNIRYRRVTARTTAADSQDEGSSMVKANLALQRIRGERRGRNRRVLCTGSLSLWPLRANE